LTYLAGFGAEIRGEQCQAKNRLKSTMFPKILKCSIMFQRKLLMFHNVPFVPGFEIEHTWEKKRTGVRKNTEIYY
jgi:hypothetical protein